MNPKVWSSLSPPLNYWFRQSGYIQVTCWVCKTRLITKDRNLAEKFLDQHEKNCVEKLEDFMLDILYP